MAKHIIRTAEPNVLLSFAFSNFGIMQVTDRKIVVSHSDGSYTIFRGTGIFLDRENFEDSASTGVITSLQHFDWTGQITDTISDFSMTTELLHYAMFHGFWLYGPLSGDDIIRSVPSHPLTAIDDHIFAGLGNDRVHAGAGNDIVDGMWGDDIIHGGEGNDDLRGDTDTTQYGTWLNGNDTLFGGAGDDRLYGGMGNDTLRGGSGIDIAVYDEAFADLTIERIDKGFRITTEDGIDTLRSIERIETSDGTYVWNATQQAWVSDTLVV